MSPPRESAPNLPAGLATLVERSRARWPGVELPGAELAAYLAERAQGDAAPDGPRAEELYLCCAALRGDPEAIRHFESSFLEPIVPMLIRLGMNDGQASEQLQALRAFLFLPREGRPPELARYAGRGQLLGWLAVMATREARRVLGRARREQPLEDSLDRLSISDSEVAYLKRTYGQTFSAAFAAAVQSLDAAERNLLRYHYVESLGVEELAALYKIHRTTLWRRLDRVRAELLARTRSELQARLGARASEIQSLLVLLRSQLDVNLGALLGPDRGSSAG